LKPRRAGPSQVEQNKTIKRIHIMESLPYSTTLYRSSLFSTIGWQL
jgi:hypothetical protein